MVSVSRIYCDQTSYNKTTNASTIVTINSTDGNSWSTNNGYDTFNIDNNEIPTCSIPLMEKAPWWCPYNYAQLYMTSWIKLCRPVACVEVDYVENFTINNLPPNICVERIDNIRKTAKICANNKFRKLNEQFQRCSKVLLEYSQYEILNNGSLLNKRDSVLLPLSEYFLTGKGTAMICATNDTGAEYANDPNSPLPWCIPIPDANSESQTAIIQNLIAAGHSVLASNKPRATVCMKASVQLSKCRRVSIFDEGQFHIDENQNAINYRSLTDYSFGDYFVDINQTILYACQIPETRSRFKEKLYGSACVLSAFFLLVALLVHIFYPKLNYHTKALLCLAFSFCVMYTVFAIRYFSPGFDYGTINVVLFCIQYIMTLSAFLWLNVLAFDLWRVFSRLKGTVGSSGGSSKKVRIFSH